MSKDDALIEAVARAIRPDLVWSNHLDGALKRETRKRAQAAIEAARPLIYAEAIEDAWKDGWACCKATVSEDAATDLTEAVEGDAWGESKTRALAEKQP